jgi:TolA-binding protein
MKNQILTTAFLALAIIFSACQNKEKLQLRDELIDLELTYSKDKSTSAPLLAKLEAYVEKFPEDNDANARYSFRAGEIYFEQKDFKNAVAILKKGVEKFKQEDATPKSLKLLGDIYAQSNQLAEALTAYSQLIREYPTHPAAKEAATNIPEEKVLTQRMANLEKMLIDSSQTPIRPSIMRELARVYQQYAIVATNKTDATDKLLKAAQNYGAIGDFVNATTILKSIISADPKTAFAKEAMFHAGYLFETMANYHPAQKAEYMAEAKKHYEMLIQYFPKDDLAKQAKLLIENLGKSDEELLDAVLKKAKK